MTIQSNLKWENQIQSIIKKINSKIPLFYQLRNLIPNEKKILIFYSLILPNIIYGIEIYAKNKCVWINTLQKAQNRLLKILFNLNKRTNTGELHKNNNVLKLSELCKLRTLLIGHKVIYYPNEKNVAHNEIQRNLINGRNMRNNINLRISAASYSAQNKVSENASILWNDIPREIKNIANRENFKKSF